MSSVSNCGSNPGHFGQGLNNYGKNTDLKVIVATDCGSTTKAIMIEKVREGDGWVYRQTFRGEAPTTVETPL